MSKEEFKSLIEGYLNQSKRVHDLDKILGCMESPIIEYGWDVFHKLITTCFTEEAVDWIYYFLLDNPENCYYYNNKRIPLECIDDLWDLVKDGQL